MRLAKVMEIICSVAAAKCLQIFLRYLITLLSMQIHSFCQKNMAEKAAVTLEAKQVPQKFVVDTAFG